MSKPAAPAPEEWLAEIQGLFDKIENEAAGVANAISSLEDPARASKLRDEWSRFVGCVMEFAVVVSDMLENAVRNRKSRGVAREG
jgi:hypothetical protein